jgi:hypoxanthine phosphoribosyltransferase
LEILISKEQLQQRIIELAQEIKRDYQDQKPVLIGTLKGCFAFLTFLALELDFDVEIDFISARSYGRSDRTSGRVDLFKNLSIDVKDRHVLLVEDIVDSGYTLRILFEDFQLAKPKSVAVVTLLNKHASHHVEVPLKYVGFDIEDDFVVGFGLDFSEKYRNLPYIAVLNRMNENQ